jgi:hypothetical protein
MGCTSTVFDCRVDLAEPKVNGDLVVSKKDLDILPEGGRRTEEELNRAETAGRRSDDQFQRVPA